MKNPLFLNVWIIVLFPALLICCSTTSKAPQSSGKVLESQTYYTPVKQSVELDLAKVRTEVEQILKLAEIHDLKRSSLNITTTNISAFDDRIEIKAGEQTTTLLYSDLINKNIVVKREYYPNARVKPNSAGSYVLWARVNGKLTQIVYKPYLLEFDNLVCILFGENNSADAKKLADDLLFIKNLSIKRQTIAQINQFESIAGQYRALKVKPPVSEEQRKLIVQANAFNQDKNYLKAIEMYNKAIDMDQTAYPSAYLNLALLSAQISNFDLAIFNMKKYLLLEPEAKDARSAQDKIYEWEIKLTK